MVGRSPDVEFSVLGALEVRVGGEPVQIGSVRQQTVLAILLLEVGRTVPIDRLIAGLWDNDQPSTVRVQVQICISRLRSRLAELGMPDVIGTRQVGYVLGVPGETVDLVRFRAARARGRDAARTHNPAAGASALREALALWRGDALVGLDSRLIRAAAAQLDEERLSVIEECVDLELALGSHRDVIGELRGLVTAHPLRERLYGLLMRALYQDGQQAAALDVYQQARRLLLDELGLDPGEELRALERAVLEQDSSLSVPSVLPAGAHPRQLPSAPRGFIGRREQVDSIRRLLMADPTSEAVVVVITGPPGVGKTALALHATHAASGQFQDGQLFAHLRGGDARPVPHRRVLGHLLRSLGVAPGLHPDDVEERAAMYRQHLAGRRILVLLDDATTSSQVEPLVPGPGGVVVVTSRSTLPGLRSAHRFELEALPPEMSLRLLAGALGDSRVAAEPAAATAVVQACGHLPLALQLVAAKLAARPHWSVTQLARRLEDQGRRLDELSLDGVGVRASIGLSFETLGSPARRLLALLGMLGATDFAAWVAGPLLDTATNVGAEVLEQLVDARLVEVQSGTGERTRYRLHDLVRAFAIEVLAAETSAASREGALDRLLRGWLFLAQEAHRREYGGEFTLLRAGAGDRSLPAEQVDELLADPIQWLDEERSNLTAAVGHAASLSDVDLCVDLAISSVTLFETRALWEEWRETHDIALAAARQQGSSRAEAVVRCSRAGLAIAEQRLADALPDLEAALAWFDQARDRHGRGLAMRALATVDRLQGTHDRATERYEQAMADLREAGDIAGLAYVLTSLAQLQAEAGDAGEAEALLAQALAMSTENGERRGEAQARYRLGELRLARGELDLAEEEFAIVDRLTVATRDPIGAAYAQLGRAGVALARNELAPAEQRLRVSLDLARQAGSRMNEARALLALAEVKLRSGDPAAAAPLLAQADDTFASFEAVDWRDRVADLRRRLTGDQGAG